jgi:hypothetical protein
VVVEVIKQVMAALLADLAVAAVFRLALELLGKVMLVEQKVVVLVAVEEVLALLVLPLVVPQMVVAALEFALP